jgi:hypothetical protein
MTSRRPPPDVLRTSYGVVSASYYSPPTWRALR